MRRWLVLSLGIGIAAVAGYALLTGARPPHAGGHHAHGPHDEISEESRAQLREILREGSSEARTP